MSLYNFRDNRKIKYGVIPAAGKGSRIASLPYTKILPKPMLPIIDKPILEYVLENMKKFGVEEIFIIVGPKKDVVIRYFEDGSLWNVKITYIEQKEPLGIAHAIGLVRSYISEPFLVILGDDITLFDQEEISSVINMFFNKNAWVIEGVVEEQNIQRIKRTCSVILGDNGKILDIEEKPQKPRSMLRGIGIYLFHPIVFNFIEKTPISNIRREKEITHTIRLMTSYGKAYAYLFKKSININVNTLEDLRLAIKTLLIHKDKM